MKYTFKAEPENMSKRMTGTSWICHMKDSGPKSFGQLLTLFGNPLYLTKNVENMYEYYISAKPETGNTVYLTAYSGPSGPAVGGHRDAASKEAAEQLVELVNAAVPCDYDYEGLYADTPSIIKQGVINGKPYYEEKIIDPDLPEDELMEILGKYKADF